MNIDIGHMAIIDELNAIKNPLQFME